MKHLVNALSNGMAHDLGWYDLKWNIGSALNVFACKENLVRRMSPCISQDRSPRMSTTWNKYVLTWNGYDLTWNTYDPGQVAPLFCTDICLYLCTIRIMLLPQYPAPITMLTPTLHCALIVSFCQHVHWYCPFPVCSCARPCGPEWLESLLLHAHTCCVLRRALLGTMRTQHQHCLAAPAYTVWAGCILNHTHTEKAPWPQFGAVTQSSWAPFQLRSHSTHLPPRLVNIRTINHYYLLPQQPEILA